MPFSGASNLGENRGFPRFKPWRRFQCIDVHDPKPRMVKRKGGKVIIKMKGLPPIKLRRSGGCQTARLLKAFALCAALLASPSI